MEQKLIDQARAVPYRVRRDVVSLAKRHNLSKVMLFGSRARGDHHSRSDVDLAISGGNPSGFVAEIDDEVESLLMFDVVNLDGAVQPELREEIERDGVLLYAQG